MFLYKIGTNPYQTVVLKETQYSSIDQLTKAFNAVMSKEIQTKVKFSYNHSSRKILVDVKHGPTLWFTGELATVLVFDQDTLIIVLFVETPRIFITANLSIRKPGSSSVLITWCLTCQSTWCFHKQNY
jgi:hypothetical protein